MSPSPQSSLQVITRIQELALSECCLLLVPVPPPGISPASPVAGGEGVVVELLPLLPLLPVLPVLPLVLGLEEVVLVGGLGGVHVGGVPV